MKTEPYLFFHGRCEEALNFYQSALGAKPGMLLRFREAPEPPPSGMLPEHWSDKIMHASFFLGDDMIMASDGCTAQSGIAGFALSLTLPDADACTKAFNALADEGQVMMAPGPTFWSPWFGSVVDRFGVNWMISVPEKASAR